MPLCIKEETTKHDLHIHTTFSDGLLEVEELLRLYAENGYGVVSVTDHDNIEGSRLAIELAPRYGLRVIPGVEVSTLHEGRDVHVLGYGCAQTPEFLDMLGFIVQSRLARAQKMLDRLDSIWGFKLDMEHLLNLSGDKDVVGRPHIARALVEKGCCRDFQEAFSRYIGDECPGHVAKQSLPPADVIRIIRDAGGIAVLAHPTFLEHDFVILDLIEMGLGGLEVFYMRHSDTATRFYRKVAQSYGLLCTGGSDFHGSKDDFGDVGEFTVPQWAVDELLAALAK
ncbi:MAG: PHP domain-containing protein [Candidatus Cloacimonetes bacterium]|nr:PHP domain-containing protein [Candidatus Cloacimonadota bacterium]